MDRRRSLALTAALAGLWLAVGYLNVARGAAHAGAGYRFWSFQHHCYSDVIALHGDRYLGGAHPLPYLEDRIEYPVLLGLALWLPSWAPGGALGHFTATYLFLAVCLACALLALARLPGARPWWLGATPALVFYAGLNWDLLPIALVAVAALAQERGRTGASGAAAALGVSAKLFPAALVPPALAALAAVPRPRALLRYAAAFGGLVLLVNLPFALAAPERWSWFFRFNAGRGAENSIWDALAIPRGPLLEALSAGPLAASALAGAVATALAARRGGDAARAARLATALALVVWIATNKILEPAVRALRIPRRRARRRARGAVRSAHRGVHVGLPRRVRGARAALGAVVPRSPVPPDRRRPDAPLARARGAHRARAVARGARSGSGCPRGFSRRGPRGRAGALISSQ